MPVVPSPDRSRENWNQEPSCWGTGN